MNTQNVFFEISWEVCNMVGGIHTVLATRVNEIQQLYGKGYIAIGPDIHPAEGATAQFRPDVWMPELVDVLSDHEVGVRMGRWLVPGEPQCLLINHARLHERKDEILGEYWEDYELDSLFGEWDYYDPVLFAHGAGMVIERIRNTLLLPRRQNAVVQAHEWMSAAAVLHLKTAAPEIGTLFTTHATMLGRSLAGSSRDDSFVASLADIDTHSVARELRVASKHSMETVAAKQADVFTTVSEITAIECEHVLARTPDIVLPNGFGSKALTPEQRSASRHHLFELAELTTGASYDRDNTSLLILAGRYEYYNKGVDMYLDAVARLRASLGDDDHRVVAFAMLPAGHAEPRRELWNRLRGESRSGEPLRCTHHLVDPTNDPITAQLDSLDIHNRLDDCVHVVQVPIYLDGSDPLIAHKYWDLLPGADLGVFPSSYEPWGYTPLEAVAFGVPAITTDRAGFGRWAQHHGAFQESGVDVLKREGVSYEQVVQSLTDALSKFCTLDPDARAALRNKSIATADKTDWSHFITNYERAHELARNAGEARRRALPRERLSSPSISDSSAAIAIGELIEADRTDGAPYTREFVVTHAVPESLSGLQTLASNLWWRWHPQAASLFKRLDRDLWFEVGEDPHALLSRISSSRLKELGQTQTLVDQVTEVLSEFGTMSTQEAPSIAYFCMEFGLAAFLRLYSGGLGVLAGDHLKAASDLNLPLCAVGLAYREGYFRQLVDQHGNQESLSDTMDFQRPPFEQVTTGGFAPLKIRVPMPTGPVVAQAWKLNVGRTPLYLLDTDVPDNQPSDRAITNRLYGGDVMHRLRQEVLLGLGGVELLDQLDIEPDAFHLNEGHSAFLLLARMERLIERHGLRSQEAIEYVRNTTVFTTHTPVAAGHDHFPEDMVRPFIARFEDKLRLDWKRLMALGATSRGNEGTEFGTTALAARCAGRINGVSKQHGEVTRNMFREFFPHLEAADDVPCTSVTNGVHVPTWLAPRWQRLVERELGPKWIDHLAERSRWDWINHVDDSEMWRIHRELKADFIDWLKEHLTMTWTRRREDLRKLHDLLERIDIERPMLGFARRFAPYKRATLLLQDPERLKALIQSDPGATFIYAGKAHPADEIGKGLLRQLYEVSKQPDFLGRLIFVEDYDIDAARRMVAGCDVWLNTPTRPLEASGTSGMKAAINGCVNLSVDDGWWCEGYEHDNGWVIDLPKGMVPDTDAFDRATVFTLLESQVLREYAQRNEHGVPTDWVRRMKASMASIIPRFSAHRMVSEYWERLYEPAVQQAKALRAEEFAPLVNITNLRQQLLAGWSDISVESVRVSGLGGEELQVGARVSAELLLHHPGIDPNHLQVEAVVNFGSQAHGTADRVVSALALHTVNEHSSWVGSFPVTASGPHQLRFRVRPHQKTEGRPGRLGLMLERWL